MYIELDHKLVPGKIEDINGDIILPGRPKNETQWMSTLLMNKYKVEKGNIKTILRDIKIKKDIDENKDKQIKKGMARDDVYFDDYFGEYLPKARNTDSNEYEIKYMYIKEVQSVSIHIHIDCSKTWYPKTIL